MFAAGARAFQWMGILCEASSIVLSLAPIPAEIMLDGLLLSLVDCDSFMDIQCIQTRV